MQPISHMTKNTPLVDSPGEHTYFLRSISRAVKSLGTHTIFTPSEKSEKGMKNMMKNLKGIDQDAFKDLKF